MAGLIVKLVGNTITIRVEDLKLDIAGVKTLVTNIAQVDSLTWWLIDEVGNQIDTGTPSHVPDEPGTWWASTELPATAQVSTVHVQAVKGTTNKDWETLIRTKELGS